MASAAVHCEALGLVMFIHCLLLIPLFYGVGPGFINHSAGEERAGLEVIKPEYILRLKIKRNDWLLADTCPQSANHCALF